MILNTNYAFFGSPKFAAVILEKLIAAKMPPAVVICNPNRPAGRKQIITPPPTKVLAEKHGITVLQPETLDEGLIFKILNSKFDVAVVAAYAKILPQAIIDAFRLGIIGVHPSLLPKYRGATPIQNALLAGEAETGTTLFLLDEKVDHGKIVSSIKYKILSQDTYTSLIEKLAALSGDLLTENLPKFIKGKIKPKIQDEALATATKKFVTGDAFVDPVILSEAKNLGGGAAIKIDRLIRALNPEPGVWSTQNNKRVKLLEAEIVNGILKIKKIQIEGGKPRIVD